MKQEPDKLQQQISPEKVADFLRELADAFESVSMAKEASGELEQHIKNYKKVSIEIKRKADQIFTKVKIKKPDNDTLSGFEAPKRARPMANQKKLKFKTLKKQLQFTFNAMRKGSEQHQLPSDELIQQFCENSKQMVTYQGEGNPEYRRYTQAVNNLKAAFDDRNLHRFKATIETLNKLKNECHRKHK